MKVSKIASLRRNATGYDIAAVNQKANMDFDLFKVAYKGRYLTTDEASKMNVIAPQGTRPWLTDRGDMLAIGFEGGV